MVQGTGVIIMPANYLIQRILRALLSGALAVIGICGGYTVLQYNVHA